MTFAQPVIFTFCLMRRTETPPLFCLEPLPHFCTKNVNFTLFKVLHSETRTFTDSQSNEGGHLSSSRIQLHLLLRIISSLSQGNGLVISLLLGFLITQQPEAREVCAHFSIRTSPWHRSLLVKKHSFLQTFLLT